MDLLQEMKMDYVRESINSLIKRKVIERDGYICRHCGMDCSKSGSGGYHFDHVYPVSRGGETSIENLVMSCVRCNSRKGAKVGIWPKPIGYFEGTPIVAPPKNESIFETELQWAKSDIKELEEKIRMLEKSLAKEKSKVYDYEHKIYNYKELQEKAQKEKQVEADSHKAQENKIEKHYLVQMFALSIVAFIFAVGFFILYTGM